MSTAVEDGLVSDATGKNALYKIHVSLGKIVNQLNEQEKPNVRSASRSPSVSVAGDDQSAVDDDGGSVAAAPTAVKEEDASDDGMASDASTVKPREEGSFADEMDEDED